MVIVGLIVTLVIGLFLSAFFSGSETGFYRATRTKLALEALGGDRVSRALIWLTNNPTLFVATTLVGNNFANYVTSWAIVLGTAQLAGSSSNGIDLAVSILLSPVIFIYGELMPKYWFFHAPNRLLRLGGPLFLLCTALFAPLAAILWLLGRVLERIVGESPERLQFKLVRSELRRVISEGHEAGVLRPTQRQMAEGMFHMATMPLERFCVPTSRLAVVRNSMSRNVMLRIARKRRSAVVFVQDQGRTLMGYLYVVDLHLNSSGHLQPKPLLSIPHSESSIAALTAMQEADEPVAIVMGEQGNMLGIVQVSTLAETVFSAS